MPRLCNALASAIVVVAALAATTSPSVAGADSWTDQRGDVNDADVDITAVTLRNTQNALVVRIDTAGLSPDKAGGTQVWIDTTADRHGPEFVMNGGTGTETDWNLWRAKRWRTASGSYPLACPVSMHVNYNKGTVIWKVASECLGEYQDVRVSVEASLTLTDYSPGRHVFHPWVIRG